MRLFHAFDHVHTLADAERVALLGGKGAGLAMMAGELGLAVPPGFTLTTEACRAYLEDGWSPALESALRDGLASLESATGRRFGHGAMPLLLSVRSGAPVSMPGMLDTVLDVGLDERSQRALERVDPRFAADCRAQLEASFEASVGEPPPDDVWRQLRAAVEAVFRSVGSSRARAFRRREGLEGDLVTAVHVQTMVFGNRDDRSATGVVFTRDPSTGEPRLYGDVLFRAQGESVVSGRRRTEAIDVLDARLPEAAAELRAAARRLERRLRDLCEIEFTIESGRLWLLQVRVGKRTPRAALRIAAELAADPDFPLDRAEAIERVRPWLADPPPMVSVSSREGRVEPPLARGVPASPGVASGEVVIDVERAVARAEQGHPVILVRPETSPSDVEGMSRAQGLLTARGGLASHAAVIARGWGIPAVVGLESLEIADRAIVVAGTRIEVGETISLDGSTGDVRRGEVRIETRPTPEATRLRGWAAELGIDLEAEPGAAGGRADASRRAVPIVDDSAPEASEAAGDGAGPGLERVEDDALLRTFAIKGSATPDSLAAALGASLEAVEAVLRRLEARGWTAPARPLGLKLSDEGRAQASALLAHDRERVGAARAEQLLEAFLELDARLKQAVTDWQLRAVGDERVPNDHSDPAWDDDVLARLDDLARALRECLSTRASGLPRLARYAERLDAARSAVRGGDVRFVASPRVDSFHGIWFELHEELIRLAGRSRLEEATAGRAG